MNEKEKKQIEKEFSIAAGATAVVLGIGVTFYYIVEKLSFVDALYFSVITLTTVGYGDISPETTIGKLFTIGYVIAGIAILAAFINLLLKRAIVHRQDTSSKK